MNFIEENGHFLYFVDDDDPVTFRQRLAKRFRIGTQVAECICFEKVDVSGLGELCLKKGRFARLTGAKEKKGPVLEKRNQTHLAAVHAASLPRNFLKIQQFSP
jgi:hypothetical protein